MWIPDPKTGEKSVTLTFFTLGFIVALGKLMFAGIAIGSFQLQPFSGMDFAGVCGALGGIYALRKNQDKDAA